MSIGCIVLCGLLGGRLVHKILEHSNKPQKVFVRMKFPAISIGVNLGKKIQLGKNESDPFQVL